VLQIKFSQKRAGGWGMFVLVTMTDRTETLSRKQTGPPFLNAFDVKASKPFVGVAPILSLFVNSRRGGGGPRFWTLSSRHFLIGPNKLEFIVITHVCHNGIKGCAFERFVVRTKMLKKVIITRVKGTKEEHDHENQGKNYFATRHIVNHPVEP
jgi:hypothetical protein